jgi:hypothetical protein
MQDRRETFKLVNNNDLPEYPVSALDAVSMRGVPKTLRAVFDGVYRAAVEPESVGDVRHLDGWPEFV